METSPENFPREPHVEKRNAMVQPIEAERERFSEPACRMEAFHPAIAFPSLFVQRFTNFTDPIMEPPYAAIASTRGG
jgi:hypothetical protein